MIRNILMPILILIILPLCMGMVPTALLPRPKRKLIMMYIMGFIMSLALFQLVAVPIIINKPDGFPLIIRLYFTLSVAIATGGLILLMLDIRRNGNPLKKDDQDKQFVSKDEKILWVFALVLIGFQMFMHLFMQSFDGDDAYYVVESLLSVETDTLYSIKPYTGLSTSMDLRHALASIPIWIAYISRMSGIHSTIIAHSIVGLAIIPLLYMIYYECATIILKKERKKIPVFLIFVSVINIFGNVSIYTDSTFFMTRTWQGKSILANIVLVAVVWLVLSIYETENIEREFRLGYWIILFLLNVVAAMCSTASVFLVALLIGIMGAVMSVVKRDVQIALRLMVTCVPLVAYGAMYMIL